MKQLSLGGRMKEYEAVWNIKLPRRMPIIMRLDGRAFHTLTRHADKPFDETIIQIMNWTAASVCEEIQGACVAYVQSDEISILIQNQHTIDTDAWFDNKIQKMVSIAASRASITFSFALQREAQFDARVFVLPEHEVINYFIWRQQDWTRNSIQMLAQSMFSHKELHCKDQKDMQEMCFSKGVNWNDLATHLKRGRCICRSFSKDWVVEDEIPIFTQQRDYFDKYLIRED